MWAASSGNCGISRLTLSLWKPIDQGIDLRLRGGIAHQLATRVGDDRCTMGTGKTGEHLRHGQQTITHAVAIGHGREHLHDLMAQVEHTLGSGLCLSGLDLQRQHAAEQFAGGAGLETHRARAVVMAGNQPP
jgi:hypothetical protein